MSLYHVPAPLFRDPIYDGPTDPVVIRNQKDNCYYMFYTQRRSTGVQIGVSTIHGTAIGAASSPDGIHWLYRGTLPGLEFEPGHNTFWAPEIIYAQNAYHMYVSYVPGIPTDWNYPRHIIHYTSSDLWNWKFEAVLPLSSDRVIDACVYEIEPGTYKMWYKDETHGSHTYSAVSSDLYNWEVLGEEICDCAHEGPNVFEFKGRVFMITDVWNGLGVYTSEDFTHWTRQQGNLLQKPGIRPMDGQIGNHADIVVKDGHAYIYYFVHPDYSREQRSTPGFIMTEKEARTVIQLAELTVENGILCCDRNRDFIPVL